MVTETIPAARVFTDVRGVVRMIERHGKVVVVVDAAYTRSRT